jgi:hypothetical protein
MILKGPKLMFLLSIEYYIRSVAAVTTTSKQVKKKDRLKNVTTIVFYHKWIYI